MRLFWVDANLPPKLARWLDTQSGCRAFHLGDLTELDAADADIAIEATRFGAVMITRDSDFVTLAGHGGPAVVHVRVGNCTNQQLISVFAEVLEGVLESLAHGASVIVVE